MEKDMGALIAFCWYLYRRKQHTSCSKEEEELESEGEDENDEDRRNLNIRRPLTP